MNFSVFSALIPLKLRILFEEGILSTSVQKDALPPPPLLISSYHRGKRNSTKTDLCIEFTSFISHQSTVWNVVQVVLIQCQRHTSINLFNQTDFVITLSFKVQGVVSKYKAWILPIYKGRSFCAAHMALNQQISIKCKGKLLKMQALMYKMYWTIFLLTRWTRVAISETAEGDRRTCIVSHMYRDISQPPPNIQSVYMATGWRISDTEPADIQHKKHTAFPSRDIHMYSHQYNETDIRKDSHWDGKCHSGCGCSVYVNVYHLNGLVYMGNLVINWRTTPFWFAKLMVHNLHNTWSILLKSK